MRLTAYLIIAIALLGISCNNDSSNQTLTIFFVHDQHGQIENFAKIKYLVDQEKQINPTILACSGDMFSGNPVVDRYPEPGFPMIDLMNQVGFDISVIGNHEFDYDVGVLKDRMQQSEFEWVCANVDMLNSGVPEPNEFKTISINGLEITFLGLIETGGKPGETIPSTHPWKVDEVSFQNAFDIVDTYSDLKEQEDSDLLIGLTHLGHRNDFKMANSHTFFDLIIGGHSNQLMDTIVNSTPIFQSGDNLNFLGKIVLNIENKKIANYQYELIELNTYDREDEEIRALIDEYLSSVPELEETIGVSTTHHIRHETVGCFVTDAIKRQLNVDMSIQNGGGVRNDLDSGKIQVKEIFKIDPFNNGAHIYTMPAKSITNFIEGSASSFYYSGLKPHQNGESVVLMDEMNQVLPDDQLVSLAINDYTVAVFTDYFPKEANILPQTTAEVIIDYLKSHQDTINYVTCERFFRLNNN